MAIKKVAITSTALVLGRKALCGPRCSCCNCKNTQYMTTSSERKCRRITLSGKTIEEDFSATEEQEE